jgi:hypothetical protein
MDQMLRQPLTRKPSHDRENHRTVRQKQVPGDPGDPVCDRRRHICHRPHPLDAIPDLSDVQVIIFTEYPGQAPQVVEDQVTYPLTTAMLSVPFAKVVRGIPFSASPSSTSSSRTVPTFTGPAAVCWNT